MITGFGAGKVILLGEHGVVYGHPALAAPLSWGVTATALPAKTCRLEITGTVKGPGKRLLMSAFDRVAVASGKPKVKIHLESDLPVSMGLGSSAAVSVACTRALFAAAGRNPSDAEVTRVAYQMETVFHGNPSGVDPACSAHRKLIHYWKSPRAAVGKVREVSSPRPIKLLVALVGPRGSTASAVAQLRARLSRWRARYQRILDQIGQLADEGESAIKRGDLQTLGDAMNINQGLLNSMQLSSPPIESMVDRLRREGALGAKLTGAGGHGGAVIGLFLEPEPVVARLTREGVQCFGNQIAGPPAL